MNLTPFTFNGATIQSADYVSHLYETSYNQPRASIIEVERTNNFPSYAGKKLNSKELYLIVDMKGTAATQIDTLNKLFDVTDSTPGTLVCKDENNSNKEWYITATPVMNDWSANSVSYTLNSDNPIWKSVTQGTVDYVGTATPGTVSGTITGNKYALPVFEIVPTGAKGTAFAFKRFVEVYNRTAKNFGNYTLNLTDDGTGTAFIAGSAFVDAGKFQSDGDDIRVIVNGAEVNRWVGGTVDSATTKVWTNLQLGPRKRYKLTSAIGTVTAGTISVDFTLMNTATKVTMPQKGRLKIDDEIFTFGKSKIVDVKVGKTVKKVAQLTRVGRAKYGTTAGTHASGGTAIWLPHEIYMMYGNSTADAPEEIVEGVDVYDKYKPAINLSESDNRTWAWTEFGDATGLMTASWKPTVITSLGQKSFYYGGNQGTEETTPFTEMGCAMKAYYRKGRWMPETANIRWSINLPAGATSLVFSGEKYRATTNSWPTVAGVWYIHRTAEKAIFPASGSISNPSSAGSWQALAGTVTTSTYHYDWAWRFNGSIRAAANNISYMECDGGTATFQTGLVPYVKLGDEISNYHLDVNIENTNTGESMTLTGPMAVGGTLTVDCKNKTVTLDDGTNCINYLTLDNPRDEWMRLEAGTANSIVYTDDGSGEFNVAMKWENRNL